MGPRTARHLLGASMGVVAAPALVFLVLDGIRGAAFLGFALQSSHGPPDLPPGAGIRLPLPSPWLATVEFIVAGARAGARRISPVAPAARGSASPGDPFLRAFQPDRARRALQVS